MSENKNAWTRFNQFEKIQNRINRRAKFFVKNLHCWFDHKLVLNFPMRFFIFLLIFIHLKSQCAKSSPLPNSPLVVLYFQLFVTIPSRWNFFLCAKRHEPRLSFSWMKCVLIHGSSLLAPANSLLSRCWWLVVFRCIVVLPSWRNELKQCHNEPFFFVVILYFGGEPFKSCQYTLSQFYAREREREGWQRWSNFNPSADLNGIQWKHARGNKANEGLNMVKLCLFMQAQVLWGKMRWVMCGESIVEEDRFVA